MAPCLCRNYPYLPSLLDNSCHSSILWGNEGFCPIVMMDANGDHTSVKKHNNDLASFLHEANLVDPFLGKFGYSSRTDIYGSRRINYIFMILVLVQALSAIEYLGSHHKAPSLTMLWPMQISTKFLCSVD